MRIAQQPVNVGARFGSPFGQGKGFGDLVGFIAQAGIVIAGVIVLFLFIFGGFKIMMSAGSDDAKGAAQGKQAVTWGVIGFVIVLAAFLILRVFELITGNDFFTVPF